MTGARIHFTLDDKAFRAGVARLGGVIGKPLTRAIGTGLIEQVQQRFESERDVWGVRWAPLLPAYAAIKKGPGILRASRRLQRSITMEAGSGSVMIGSNMIYAAVHQFGATIKAKTPKGLAFMLGGSAKSKGNKKGTFLVRVQSVFIPQRPYLGFGPKDERSVLETLQGAFDRA